MTKDIKVWAVVNEDGTVLPWTVGDGPEWAKSKFCDYMFEMPSGPSRFYEFNATVEPYTLTKGHGDD